MNEVELLRKEVRFFTLPPFAVFHPYVFVNGHRPEAGLRYLRRWGRRVKAVIVDSGIEIFRDPTVKDYPDGHLHRMVLLYDRVRTLCPNAEVRLTCLDYCDDYHPKALWLSPDYTNIERTVDSVVRCFDRYPDVNWLVPIQGHYGKPLSVAKCIRLLDEAGIDGDYYAIANLCVERRVKPTTETIRIVRLLLPTKRLHAFGISLPIALKNRHLIDSFDSMAWTFPRERGKPSCKTTRQRIEYFRDYMRKLHSRKNLSLKSLLPQKTLEATGT